MKERMLGVGRCLLVAMIPAGCFSTTSSTPSEAGSADSSSGLDVSTPPDTGGGSEADGNPEAMGAEDANLAEDVGMGDDLGMGEDVSIAQDAGSADTSVVPDGGGMQDSGGPTGDGSGADAEGNEASSGCSMVGTWTGTYSCPSLSGRGYTWVIRGDGTATGTIQGVGVVQQTWSVSGDAMTLTDSTCGSAGSYALAFNASCGQVKMTEISDPCAGRGMCVDGLVVTRQ
jgi:hypothetical protein